MNQWVLVTVGHNPPVPASSRCCIWLSRLGFQDLDKRALGFTLRTWVSGPQKLSILRRLIFFPSFFSVSTITFLFPITFLYVHRHFSFSHHFSLRPPSLFFFPSLFSASTFTFLCVHRHFSLRPVVTDARTPATSDFIYKMGV